MTDGLVEYRIRVSNFSVAALLRARHMVGHACACRLFDGQPFQDHPIPPMNQEPCSYVIR